MCLAPGMSEHLALFHFAPAGLLVRGDVLGTSYFLERDRRGSTSHVSGQRRRLRPSGRG